MDLEMGRAEWAEMNRVQHPWADLLVCCRQGPGG